MRAVCAARTDGSALATLRASVHAALTVLNDATAGLAVQHAPPCAIANDLFDPLTFSHRALGAPRPTFTPSEQDVFTTVVGGYLCTCYLTRLRLR